MRGFNENYYNASQKAANRLHIKNALNAILWLCAISTPICFFFAYLFYDTKDIKYLLVCTGMLPIVVACIVFVIFAVFKPNKLQSEDYLIRKMLIQLIQQKGGKIKLPPTRLELIANPSLDKHKRQKDE